MSKMRNLAAAAIVGVGGLVAAASSASAAIVCNAANECWHVRRAYAYQPAWGVVVHPNGWRWGPGEHYVWREHPGRGYWRNGAWVTF